MTGLFLPTAVEYIPEIYIFFHQNFLLAGMSFPNFIAIYTCWYDTCQTEDAIQNPKPRPEDLCVGLVDLGRFWPRTGSKFSYGTEKPYSISIFLLFPLFPWYTQ